MDRDDLNPDQEEYRMASERSGDGDKITPERLGSWIGMGIVLWAVILLMVWASIEFVHWIQGASC